MDAKTLRIIDANINRLMEGLRVVEEYPRFVLDDRKTALKIKELRAKAKDAVRLLDTGDDLVCSRDSRHDVGRGMYTKSESDRKTMKDIITSNIKRAQEAARVLEEVGKLKDLGVSGDRGIGKRFKEIRYELYDVEKTLIKGLGSGGWGLGKVDRMDFGLYVVTDPDVLGKRSPVEAVKKVIKGGCRIVQLRDKKASIGQYYKWAMQIAPICKKAGVSFIVNDYLDVCIAVAADGVHLGQDDVPISVARKLLGPDKIIGLSTHSRDQALKGAKSGADYISIGPVFTTASKPNTVPVGIELVKWASKNIKLPFVAIGGINEKNLSQVLKAGAKKAAVIRAAIGNKEIEHSVKKLRRAFK